MRICDVEDIIIVERYVLDHKLIENNGIFCKTNISVVAMELKEE